MGLGRWVGEREGVGGIRAEMVEEWVEHYRRLWCWGIGLGVVSWSVGVSVK